MESQAVKLIENISFEGVEFNETDGVRTIRNVVMLGPISKKGYTYRESAMQKAVPLYNGVQCFLNHPTEEEEKVGRDVMKIAGSFRNPRFEGGKLKGDISLLPDAMGQKFWDIAKTMPHAASCSHVADGNIKTVNGERYVEEITKVLSVDLVSRGATTSTVFEGHPGKDNEMEFKDIKIEELRSARPDLINILVQEGAESRDEEVKKVTDELTETKKSLDEFKVKESVALKKGKVEKLLADSKLPDSAKTDTFREQLMAIGDEDFDKQAKKLLEDRQALVGGVKNMGGDKGQKEAGGLKESHAALVSA